MSLLNLRAYASGSESDEDDSVMSFKRGKRRKVDSCNDGQDESINSEENGRAAATSSFQESINGGREDDGCVRKPFLNGIVLQEDIKPNANEDYVDASPALNGNPPVVIQNGRPIINGTVLLSCPNTSRSQGSTERTPKTNVEVNGDISKAKLRLKPKPIPLESSFDVGPQHLIDFAPTAKDIMKQMGFQSTRGLGRRMRLPEMDTRISPERLADMEKFLRTNGIDVSDNVLDFDEVLQVDETVDWIPPSFSVHPLDLSSLRKGLVLGPQKNTISDETKYIDPPTLNKMSLLKKAFDCLHPQEYQQVRARSNPYETIGKGPFICRAGMKLANLDAVLSYAITCPTSNLSETQPTVRPNELFYFADVCAGPGGFTEYILRKKGWHAKGFGMTLKGEMDFDLLSFLDASPESFEPLYGPAGDGNVYNPLNTDSFIQHVMEATANQGVHLLMADGGFEVENKELTEVASAQIYLAQCHLALSCVASGGTFVCKMFDTLTPFTAGLLFLMYNSFDLVAIHKPKTSRPANSERYLVCKWKKKDLNGIPAYLREKHVLFWKLSQLGNDVSEKETILHLVPPNWIDESKEFANYLARINTVLARRQVKCLEKMVVFARRSDLRDPRQESIKKRCFDAWELPFTAVSGVPVLRPAQTFYSLTGQSAIGPESFVTGADVKLLETDFEHTIKSPYDWRVVVVQASGRESGRGYYLALGDNKVYFLDGAQWKLCIEGNLVMCKNTLIYGEFVDEVSGKKNCPTVKKAFHIIDAMFLGGVDIRNLHYTCRHEACIQFAKAMHKPSRPDLCRIRTKIPIRTENIADLFDRLKNKPLTRNGCSELVCPVDHTDETLPFIKPAGILFIRITKEPWTMAFSRSHSRKYYFNMQTRVATYESVAESIASFEDTCRNRAVWDWDRDLKTKLATQDVTVNDRPIILVSPTALNPHTVLRHVGGDWLNQNGMRRSSSTSSTGSLT